MKSYGLGERTKAAVGAEKLLAKCQIFQNAVAPPEAIQFGDSAIGNDAVRVLSCFDPVYSSPIRERNGQGFGRVQAEYR